MGAMPPMLAQGADAEAIATYVAGGMQGTAPTAFSACVACHGTDGKGNNGMAPSLVGYDEALVSNVLEHGKKGAIGAMPSFKTRLTPVQEKALAVYIQKIKG